MYVSVCMCVCVCECVYNSVREREKEANPDHDSTPLSTNATRRSRDRSLTRTVEVLDQRAIQDVPGRNPTPLLRTVPLPVHQKLVTTPTRTDVKELTDSVNRSLLVNRRRRKGGAGRSTDNRLDAGHVKNRVNTAQLTGQSESDRDRTENLNNRKGPNKAGHQLARTLLDGQIAGGKPHLLTTNIPGGPDPVTISGSTCARSSTT